LVAAAAAVVLLTPTARAQDVAVIPQDYQDYDAQNPATPAEYEQDEIPAHLSVVDGEVTIEREGRVDPADENIILVAGDRLRTARGRAEVLFSDGSVLSLDEHSSVDLLADSLARLLDGRMRLAIARGDSSLAYRVDTAAGSVFIQSAGEYRLTLLARGGDPELDLAVLRGSAELANQHGRTLVRAGTHALVSARTAPSLPYATNSAAWDSFDRWVEDQRNARLGVQSARYLPEDLRYYGGALDTYGSWGYDQSYGYVWYPQVSHGWRPYSHGRWSFVGHFGWVWVGVDRWSWATHHYGRWGFHKSRWFWMPGRRWSPAWVSWAYAPGYVSWCPLGFDNRPVISFTNIHITRIDPWIGWTVVPTRSFRANVAVARYAVARQAVTPRLWSQFAVQRTSPLRPAALPARALQPLRAPTAARAVARGAVTTPQTTGGTADRRGIAGARSGAAISTPTAPRSGAAARTGSAVARPGTSGVAPLRDPSRPATTLRSGSAAPTRNPAPSGAAARTGRTTLMPPRDPQPNPSGTRQAAPRPQSRLPQAQVAGEPPRSAAPAQSAPPSRTIRSREPSSPPAASAPPSRTIRSRPPSTVPSPAARPSPSRAAPRGGSGGGIPSSAPAPSASPWRSRSAGPPAAAAPPSRSVAPSRRISPPPAASAPASSSPRSRSSAGWGSPSRVAPRSSGSSSAPSARPAPSRSGGAIRPSAPSASRPSASRPAPSGGAPSRAPAAGSRTGGRGGGGGSSSSSNNSGGGGRAAARTGGRGGGGV
jgi:hypothetical protein